MIKRKGFMAGFLAATAMLGFLAVFAFLALGTVPVENRDFFNMALVALIGLVGTAFGYYLGSSDGSARKNDLLASAAAPPPGNPEAGYARPQLLIVTLLVSCAMMALPMLSGCAVPQNSTKQSLAAQALLSTQAAVIGIAQAADSLCTQGTLTQPQCDRVAKLYTQAQLSYDLAAEALGIAMVASTPETWPQYQVFNEQFFRLYSSMTAAAVEFGIMPAVSGGAR